tara:strand:- start:721 stop:975 length:255 start_codon:yes stop_codon:yes gene_type:complete
MDIKDYKAWLKDHQLPLAPVDVSNLIGENALTLVIAVKKALVKQGWSEEDIQTFHKTALSGDYDKVISICVESCDEGSYRNQGE